MPWIPTFLDHLSEDGRITPGWDYWGVEITVLPDWLGRTTADPLDRLFGAGWVAPTAAASPFAQFGIDWETMFVDASGVHCDGLNVHLANLVEVDVYGLTWSDTPIAGSIAGVVWVDVDANCTTESFGALGETVTLRLGGDIVDTTVVVGGDSLVPGTYGFTDLEPGEYTVEITGDDTTFGTLTWDGCQANPLPVTVVSDEAATPVHFGQFGG